MKNGTSGSLRGAFAAAGLIGAALLPTLTAPPAIASEAGALGTCAYEYQSRCVTWVTTLETCHLIFQRTTDGFKHQACAMYAVHGIVTVIP